jgi:imidazolonepropionase-like amidohydrolase
MSVVGRFHPQRKGGALIIKLRGLPAAATLLGIAVLLAVAQAGLARADGPSAVAIKDAQIVTGKGKPIEKGTVVFRDGLITEVGPSARVPADARVIDGTGLTVYPGLIDGYTTLGLPAPPQTQRGAQGSGPPQVAAPAAGQPQQAEQTHGDPSASAADQVKPGGTAIEDARSAGVTAALTSPRQGIFPGQSALINLAGVDSAKMVVRAPVALTVQFSSGGGFGGGYPGSLMGTVAFIRQSFFDAIRYRDEVNRYNRVKRGVARPEYDKKLAALQPALKGEMPVLFVANSDGDIRRALTIADEFKLKPIIAGAMYGYRVTELLKSRNVPVILSLDFPRRAADLPDDEDEPLRVLRERAEAPTAAASLTKAGVKFAFMSGSLRPQEFIANVQKAVESGLSREEALQALTINAAEIFGAGDQLGTVEVGKIANLVVTSGHLLAKDSKVRHVFIDGAEIELKKPETPAQRFGSGERGPGRGTPGAAAVDPTGDWNLVVRTPQGEMNVTLSLRRDGERVSGTMTEPAGVVELRNVTLNGNQLRFTATVNMHGNGVETTMSGTIEGDSIRGVFTLSGMGSFDFSGTRPR